MIMKTNFKKTLCFIALVLFLFYNISCDNTDENLSLNQNVKEIYLNDDSVIENFSKSLALVLAENLECRKLIKNEALKKINHDFDVLYVLVKDIKLSDGTSLENLLLEHIDEKQLNFLTDNFPTLTIFVPTLPNNSFSCESWKLEDQIPDIAVRNYGGNKTYCYNSQGEEYYLENDEIPGYPIVVLKINERISVKKNNDNNSIAVRSSTSDIELEFIDPIFNNITTSFDNITPFTDQPKTRVSGTDIKLQKVRDSYEIFPNNTEGWQRDYVYYNLTNQQDRGKFDLRYKEAIVGFQLVGNVDALLNKIADQPDDPRLINRYDWFVMRKKYPDQNPTPLTCWTEGEFEFEVIYQVVSKNLASSSHETMFRCSPESLFDVETIESSGSKTKWKITNITTKYKFLEVPLFEWNIENYGASYKISISEFDQSETFTTQYTSSVEFATNFGFDATFGENVKQGLKFGSSSKETSQITNSVVKTLKSDDLGSVIINFGDEIIMNDEWISTGLGWRGYRSRLNYNPKYKTAYYTLHVAPLFYGN